MMYIDKNDPYKDEVIAYTVDILKLMLPTYALCGVMETLAGSLRGLGYSVTPMVINLIGTCGSRILWVFVFFRLPAFNSITGLFLIYPISWILTSLAHLTVLIFAWQKMHKEFSPSNDKKIPEKVSETAT